MDIDTKVAAGCEGVRHAFETGHLRNQSLFSFAFTKAITELPDCCPAFLDTCPFNIVEGKLNFFILDKKDDPSIIFVARLRYGPSNLSIIKGDLKELADYSKESEVTVWMDYRTWEGVRVPVSSRVAYGYFVLTNISSVEIKGLIEQLIPLSVRPGFHYAIDTLKPANQLADISTYFAPKKLVC